MQVNHLVQLVPTIYEDWSGSVTEGYQYSAQTNYKRIVPGAASFPLPGVFIKWDISPFVIQYRETGRSFAHFLTRVCAITGGTFVVLGMPGPPHAILILNPLTHTMNHGLLPPQGSSTVVLLGFSPHSKKRPSTRWPVGRGKRSSRA
jgi:hypothetical protein